MKVLKFGGASLKDADSLKLIAQIIKREKKDQVVVLSALGGVTNKLESFLRYPARQNEKEIRLFLEQLKKHAAALQKTTTYGDESIMVMQSLLATFRNVQGDVFTRATKMALDMSQALGQDLKSSSIMLGKHLFRPATR